MDQLTATTAQSSHSTAEIIGAARIVQIIGAASVEEQSLTLSFGADE